MEDWEVKKYRKDLKKFSWILIGFVLLVFLTLTGHVIHEPTRLLWEAMLIIAFAGFLLSVPASQYLVIDKKTSQTSGIFDGHRVTVPISDITRIEYRRDAPGAGLYSAAGLCVIGSSKILFTIPTEFDFKETVLADFLIDLTSINSDIILDDWCDDLIQRVKRERLLGGRQSEQ
jgi:hypothetical protein